jgi:hypothetical protein
MVRAIRLICFVATIGFLGNPITFPVYYYVVVLHLTGNKVLATAHWAFHRSSKLIPDISDNFVGSHHRSLSIPRPNAPLIELISFKDAYPNSG